jgi:hypothetical protein
MLPTDGFALHNDLLKRLESTLVKPISTAPVDGSCILLACLTKHPSCFGVGKYLGHDWYDPDGWSWENVHGCLPTHWTVIPGSVTELDVELVKEAVSTHYQITKVSVPVLSFDVRKTCGSKLVTVSEYLRRLFNAK